MPPPPIGRTLAHSRAQAGSGARSKLPQLAGFSTAFSTGPNRCDVALSRAPSSRRYLAMVGRPFAALAGFAGSALGRGRAGDFSHASADVPGVLTP